MVDVLDTPKEPNNRAGEIQQIISQSIDGSLFGGTGKIYNTQLVTELMAGIFGSPGSALYLLAGDVVYLDSPKLIAYDSLSSCGIDYDGSPTLFPDLSVDVLPESMQTHWIESLNNLIDPTQLNFSKAREWNVRQFDEIAEKDKISQKELNTAAYVFTISEMASSYMPHERVNFIEWIYLSAAYSLDVNVEFFSSELGQSFVDSLKHFMFPLEDEDVETFQLRMNLLQYIRHNIAVERSEDIDSVYDNFGGWIESQGVLQSLSKSEVLKSNLELDLATDGFDVYRLKASESGANTTDTFALTFEVSDLSAVLKKLDVPSAMEEAQPGVLISSLGNLDMDIVDGDNHIAIDSARYIEMGLSHGEVGIGGYNTILLKGRIQREGIAIPLEIQIVESGDTTYQLSKKYQENTLSRIPSKDAQEGLEAVALSNRQARFISRLPWSRDPEVHFTHHKLLTEFLILAGGISKDIKSSTSQQQLVYELDRRKRGKLVLGQGSREDVLTFISENWDLIEQMSINTRWNLSLGNSAPLGNEELNDAWNTLVTQSYQLSHRPDGKVSLETMALVKEILKNNSLGVIKLYGEAIYADTKFSDTLELVFDAVVRKEDPKKITHWLKIMDDYYGENEKHLALVLMLIMGMIDRSGYKEAINEMFSE